MNQTKGTFNSTLTRKCKRRLRKFFRSGNTLRIPELEKAKFSALNHSTFYHYTFSKTVESNVLNNDIDSFFVFNRVERQRGNSTSVYVAKDPVSSSMYGDIQIKFELNPQAVILKYDDNQLKELVLSSFPETSTCWGDLSIASQENAYLNLVLEENDIDLYAYFEARDWYQLIKRTNIKSVSIGKFKEW
ncbi:MAG: hypothetical protein KA715_08785 [Xanthomonadaceae bacterium]|nr:hypothetical protein [Xanthomonadaceae bacterium]